MTPKEILNQLLNHLELNISQFSIAVKQGAQTFYDIRNEKIKSITPEVANKIIDAFPEISLEWLIFGKGSMLKSDPFTALISEPQMEYKTPDPLQKLAEVQKRKSAPEGSREVNEDDLVDSVEIEVPVKGQAGLCSTIYADELVQKFTRKTIKTKPQHRGVFYKIEVVGMSMTPKIQSGDWVRCEDISSMFWKGDNFFKEGKMYCIWHNERGIIFKRITYAKGGVMMCISDNPDKTEYPDFELELAKVSKIMVVKKLVDRDL